VIRPFARAARSAGIQRARARRLLVDLIAAGGHARSVRAICAAADSLATAALRGRS
jgi:hypothetical protein